MDARTLLVNHQSVPSPREAKARRWSQHTLSMYLICRRHFERENAREREIERERGREREKAREREKEREKAREREKERAREREKQIDIIQTDGEFHFEFNFIV